MCAATGAGRWQRYGFSHASPKGWHHWDGKHLCGLDCLIEHLKELRSAERAADLNKTEAKGGPTA